MQRLLLAIIILEIPIQIDGYLFYQKADAAYGALGGLNISIATICLAILYIAWILETVWHKNHDAPPVRASLPAVFYVAAVAASAVLAYDRKLVIFDFFLLVQAFLLYVYVGNRTRTREDVVFLVTMFSVALLVEAALVVGIWFVGHNMSIGILHLVVDGSRSAGSFGSPNSAGSFLALMLVPSASVWFMPVERWRKVLATSAVSLGTVALVLTQSRGAWIAFVVASVFLFAVAWRRGWISAKLPVAIALGTAIMLAPVYHIVGSRLSQSDEGAAASRIPLIKMGVRVIADNPVVGVGSGNSHLALLQQSGTLPYRQEWFYMVHNQYVLVGAETGLVGLIFFLGFLGYTLRQGWKGWKLGDRLLSPVALTLTAAILGQMTHMLVELFNGRPQLEAIWCCAGLVAAIGSVYANEPSGGKT